LNYLSKHTRLYKMKLLLYLTLSITYLMIVHSTRKPNRLNQT